MNKYKDVLRMLKTVIEDRQDHLNRILEEVNFRSHAAITARGGLYELNIVSKSLDNLSRGWDRLHGHKKG